MVNTVNKGNRIERKAQKELEAMGYKVIRPKRSRFSAVDFFGVFDIIAMKLDNQVLCIQVKTNRMSNMKGYLKEMSKIAPYDYVDCEYWIWYDRKGWRKFCLVEAGTQPFWYEYEHF